MTKTNQDEERKNPQIQRSEIKAFISYSYDDKYHQEWVKEFATRLRNDGIDALLDQWELIPGDQIPAFMEKAVRESNYVLIICTHKYKKRSERRIGGVGYEGDIMTSEIMNDQNQRKFIPILRQKSRKESLPNWLSGKKYIDLSSTPYLEEKYQELISTLFGIIEKAPPIRKPFFQNTGTTNAHLKIQNYDGTKLKKNVQQALLRPGYAPPPPPLFIGRDKDLQTLRARLTIREEPIQVITTIKGWPGVGKTTIASKLAHDTKITDLYTDGVLWTSLGQNPNVFFQIQIWGRVLGLEAINHANSIKEAQLLLCNYLKNRSMLLIIDDVWEIKDVIPFIAGGEKCATIITTRSEAIANTIAPTENSIYRLNGLGEKDGLELLNKLAPTVVSQYPKESRTLVNDLEGLPLAIQVAGHFFSTELKYGYNVLDLLNEIREGAKLLEATAPIDFINVVNETTPTIASLLMKSLNRLDHKTIKRYAYLGVYAPKPAVFDKDLLKKIWQTNDPKPTIRILVDRGLLEYIQDLECYQMHSLLVMLARTLLK